MSVKSGNRPHEFTAAASDEVSTSEKGYRVVWHTYLLPTKRRGVWEMEVRVIDQADTPLPVTVVRYRAEWPNSTPQTFEAFLYGVCYRTARMVEEWAVQHKAQSARERGL